MGNASILLERGLNYLKRRMTSGIQTNLDLTDDSNADWLQKCDELAVAWLTEPAKAGFLRACVTAGEEYHSSLTINNHVIHCLN